MEARRLVGRGSVEHALKLGGRKSRPSEWGVERRDGMTRSWLEEEGEEGARFAAPESSGREASSRVDSEQKQHDWPEQGDRKRVGQPLQSPLRGRQSLAGGDSRPPRHPPTTRTHVPRYPSSVGSCSLCRQGGRVAPHQAVDRHHWHRRPPRAPLGPRQLVPVHAEGPRGRPGIRSVPPERRGHHPRAPRRRQARRRRQGRRGQHRAGRAGYRRRHRRGAHHAGQRRAQARGQDDRVQGVRLSCSPTPCPSRADPLVASPSPASATGGRTSRRHRHQGSGSRSASPRPRPPPTTSTPTRATTLSGERDERGRRGVY